MTRTMESYLIYASNGLSNLTASESYDQSQRPIRHRNIAIDGPVAKSCGLAYAGPLGHTSPGNGVIR
jgi:hypothetical protein